MIRRFLLVALAGLGTVSGVAAGEYVSVSDVGMPQRVAPDDSPARSAHSESTTELFPKLTLLDDSVGDSVAATADESKPQSDPESPERPFHGICDCGCHVPCLDHWCVYDIAFCHGPILEHHACECAYGTTRITENGEWVSNDAHCDVWGPQVYTSMAAARFGWWGVGTDGSQQKTGEFQDLESSPFWDVDAVSSDGVRTWDIVLSGLDQEANDAHVLYYSPSFKGKFDFQRYLRRTDHDPLSGFVLPPNPTQADIPPGPPPEPQGNVIVEDLNVGEDYAIRVEELDAKYQGRIADHLKWRLNVWGQRKFGERQSTATAHCFNVLADAPPGANGNVCHVLSQRQSIDWLTMEIQPVVEANFENVTVEYSRTMRALEEDDQSVFRQYTRFGFQREPAIAANNGFLGPDFEYALVPESFTQIDRLKASAQLNDANQLYANLYLGDTENKFRDMHREYSGYDLRLINRAIDDTTVTWYASRYDESNEFPPFFLDEPPFAPAPVPPAISLEEQFLRHPIDYRRTRAGVKGTWQPFGDRGRRCSNYGLWDGTSLASGYEYYQLERDFVTYNVTPVPFTQPNTKSHQIEFGPSTRWSRSFDTFTRYKVRFIEDPLIGVSERSEDPPEAVQAAFNSNQPEQEHIVELGSTWAPTANFMTTAKVDLVNSWHRSEFANFDEDTYPTMVTVWYAPTHRLSLTGGYAFYSNWIDQDITLGAFRGDPAQTERTRWDYDGENHLVSLNANYALTPCVQLISGYEFNRGSNTFNIPISPHAADGVDWTTVEQVADVIVETHRVTAGVDWQPYRDTNLYFRYIFYDWQDISAGFDSGTAHMALAGATRTW
jgi:hypothetical protein